MLDHRTQLPVPHRRSRRGAVWVGAVAVLVTAAALVTSFLLVRSPDDDTGDVAANTSARAVVVFDRTTGRTVRGDNATARFRSASLVKLLIALDLLDRGAVTPVRPSPRMSRMLSYSDDGIAQQLWDSGGGGQIVTRMAQSLGLHDTRPPAVDRRWGDTRISANDVVSIYR
ncbi:hypothetical protein FNH05_10710, partial [Amycolatopsis rhizosphaerae]